MEHGPLSFDGKSFLTSHEYHFARQGGLCYYCKRQMVLAPKKRPDLRNETFGGLRCTVDHQIPLSRGGTNHIDNQVGACDSCNKRKDFRTADEFLLRIDANVILWLRVA